MDGVSAVWLLIAIAIPTAAIAYCHIGGFAASILAVINCCRWCSPHVEESPLALLLAACYHQQCLLLLTVAIGR